MKQKTCHRDDDPVCKGTSSILPGILFAELLALGAPTATGKGCHKSPYFSNAHTIHMPKSKEKRTKKLKPEAPYLLHTCT